MKSLFVLLVLFSYLAYAALPTVITLKSNNGNYLSRCRGCAPVVFPHSSNFDMTTVHIGAANSQYVKWNIEYLPGYYVRLKSDNGRYLSRCNGCFVGGAQPDMATIHIPDETSPYVKWKVEFNPNSNMVIRLKSDNNKYLSRCNQCVSGSTYPDQVTLISDANSPDAQWTVDQNLPRMPSGPWNRTAVATTYESFPAPGTTECESDGFNGCFWQGQFAYFNEKKTEEWVKTNNIVSMNEQEYNILQGKTIWISSNAQGTDAMPVQVFDKCANSDCNNCCTNNMRQANPPQTKLIDLEKYTANRFKGHHEGTDEMFMEIIYYKV